MTMHITEHLKEGQTHHGPYNTHQLLYHSVTIRPQHVLQNYTTTQSSNNSCDI